MYEILIVEDDTHSALLTKTMLSRGGFNTTCAINGIEGLKVLSQQHIDCIVLDVMMPQMDGYQFAKRVRAQYEDLPILMLTAKDSTLDKVKGFECGVDDYCIKPIDQMELIARINALLRRYKISLNKAIELNHTTLNYDLLSVNVNGQLVECTKKEFQLLFKLLSFPDKIFTRNQLMEEFWAFDKDTTPHSVDVHINRLRTKFKDNQDFEIVTVRGLGYKAHIYENE